MENEYYPIYWKYCTKCGKELEREWGDSRFDVISGKEYKLVIVYCPLPHKDSLYHTWNTYEGDSLERLETPF